MNRIPRHEYFLNIAKTASMRSTCLKTQYGAVIVKDNKIVSTGYNGSACGEKNCIDKGSCNRKDCAGGEGYDKCPAVHAEMNGLINGDADKIKGSTIYIVGVETNTGIVKIGREPCIYCNRLIINAGISEVVVVESNDNGTLRALLYIKNNKGE